LLGTHPYNRAGRHEMVDACDLIDARDTVGSGTG